jgi:hypothetical protein
MEVCAMKWLRKVSRTWCAAFVGCAMAVALGAAPANAATDVTDGFEPETQAEWYLFARGPELCFASQYGSDPICETPGHATISNSKSGAHSGDNYLYMLS